MNYSTWRALLIGIFRPEGTVLSVFTPCPSLISHLSAPFLFSQFPRMVTDASPLYDYLEHPRASIDGGFFPSDRRQRCAAGPLVYSYWRWTAVRVLGKNFGDRLHGTSMAPFSFLFLSLDVGHGQACRRGWHRRGHSTPYGGTVQSVGGHGSCMHIITVRS
jgi:hypothetical protein